MPKKSKKKGKGSKKKKGKKSDKGAAAVPNWKGFHPDGEPLKVFKVDREAVVVPVAPKTPTDTKLEVLEAQLAERGSDPATQPARQIRVGERLRAPVADLKRRIWEVTGLGAENMHLLFACSAARGGRCVRELRGYEPHWPWPADMTVTLLDDNIPLGFYGIGVVSKAREAERLAVIAEHEKSYASDPEYKIKFDKQSMADKLAKEKAKESKGKKGKKGKKGGKGGKGAPKPQKMSKKEEAAFEAKEASRVEKERLEKVAKRDKIRKWPENQVYLVQKPEGMQNLPVFMTQPGLPDIETPKNTFMHAMPRPMPFQNSDAKAYALGLNAPRDPSKPASWKNCDPEQRGRAEDLVEVGGGVPVPPPVEPKPEGEAGADGGDLPEIRGEPKKKKSGKKKSKKKKK